jgi:GcrA cell cycle regulator
MTLRGPNINQPWTPARIEELSELWRAGVSASQIAKRIGGTTRNAVIGKVTRLGLPPRSRDAAEQSSSFMNRSRERVVAMPQRQPLPKLREIAPDSPRPWSTRAFGECAYPVSGEGADVQSCCNPCVPIVGWSYCAAHRELMFRKPATDAQRKAAARARAAKAKTNARAA